LNASAVEEDMQYEKSKKKVNKKNTKTKKIRIIFDAFEKRKMKKKIQKKDYCTKIYISLDGTTHCVSMFYYSSRK
jgi:hypothetical protein